MARKLTRIQTLLAGSAFAVAGIGGGTAAAFAHHSDTPTVDPQAAAQATIDQAVPDAGQAAPAEQAPSEADLHPVAVTATQAHFTPDAEQLENAKAIVDTAKDMGLPPRAWEIAVATSIQESNLHNIGDLGSKNDHDSRGLFQQRIGTGGWGTESQIMDPHHATEKFLQRLEKVDGWQNLPLTTAAQKVQVSAYPQAYAKHEAEAGDIIQALYHQGPYADQS